MTTKNDSGLSNNNNVSPNGISLSADIFRYFADFANNTMQRLTNIETQMEKLVVKESLVLSDKQRAKISINSIFGIPNQYINLFNNLVVPEDQLDILQEECAELIQACSKVKRNKPNAFASLKEEMAHVLVSSAMIATMLDITEEDIYLELQKKEAKFLSPTYKGEPKINRDRLFEKYKERARLAYETK